MLGSPKTDNMYHAGWGWAGSTPYKGTKLLASHFGGTRNPMAVRWPAKIKPDATPRAQFHHCNDVVPTIYEILGITPPRVVHGVPQDPIDGVSLAYTFDDAKAHGPFAHSVFRGHGQPRDLPRRLDGVRIRSAHSVGSGTAAGHQANGRPIRTSGNSTIWRKTGRRPTTSPTRCRRSWPKMKEIFLIEAARNQALPIGGGLWIAIFTQNCEFPRHTRSGHFRGQHHSHAGVLRPGVGQQDRTSSPSTLRSRPTRTACSMRSEDSPAGSLLCLGRGALLRIQPVHHPAHADPRQGQTAHRQGED